MNKFLTTLLATALLSLGTASFAADVAKTTEPAKMEAPATPAAETAKPVKKHTHKHHAKKAADAADAAPAVEAPAAK